MKKLDLTDTTFTIPVKIESESRFNNLVLVLRYLQKHLDTHFIICEQDSRRCESLCTGNNMQYFCDSRNDGMLHRTRQLNRMALAAFTPLIVNYDADVLMPPERYLEAVTRLRETSVTGVIPYMRLCYDIPYDFHDQITSELSIKMLGDHSRFPSFGRGTVGGAVFWRKEYFIQGGMENERFIGWGAEDNERAYRFSKLKHTIVRLEGDLLHLRHERSPHSNKENPHYQFNKAELDRIRSMDRAALLKEVGTWPWCMGLRQPK
jgi:hypothetical protein